MNLRQRVEQLERQATVESVLERHEQMLLGRYEDVRAWLVGDGPAPDIHRVNDMFLTAWKEAQSFDDVEYAEFILAVVWDCIARRYHDKTGKPAPDPEDEEAISDLVDFFEIDPVSIVWHTNAAQDVEEAKEKRAGKKPKDIPHFLGHRLVLPVTPECGPECRLRKIETAYETIEDVLEDTRRRNPNFVTAWVEAWGSWSARPTNEG